MQNNKQNIDISNVDAETGGVSVGVAQNGSHIKVYNIEVTEAIIKRVLHDIESSISLEDVTLELFDYLERFYHYLPLKGMGRTSELSLKFPLINLFIPLNVRLTIPKCDTLEENYRLAGRKLSEEEVQSLGGITDKSVPIINLIEQNPVLVILGDPGSGKSTVMRFLTYLLATAQGKVIGLGGYLPLLLPLANYSEKLVNNPDLNLRHFATEHIHKSTDIEGVDALIEAKLKQGKVLILLDGLDEVREVQLRNIVVERVQRFLCKYIPKGNRVVMTSRIIGYQEVRPPEVEGLRECTLLDFDKDEINTFIQRWTQVIEQQAYDAGNVAQYEAKREAKELISAVEDNPSVRKLAANPLLLTMLVKEKRQGVALPRHRVVLYERYIASLMDDWLLARTQRNSTENLPSARILRKTLEPLAWWLQETEPGKGLVNETKLLSWLCEFYQYEDDPEETAERFIKEVREYSGLLLDRGGSKYGFLHLTFMEYLAAVHLANQFQKRNGLQKIIDTIQHYANKSGWHEVLLLSIGHLALNQAYDEVTTEILQQLLSTEIEGQSTHAEIVASALADIGKDGITQQGWGELRQNLLRKYCLNPAVKAKQRTQIARLLADSQDPRREVLNIDDMQFCFIPRGHFFLGSTENDSLAYDREKGAGSYTVEHDYWLARFPVTVLQFNQFIEETDFNPTSTQCATDIANTPVVYVSWKEAMSFCRWLTNRWKEQGYLPNGYVVTLPSEPEWEMAAKGGSKLPRSKTDNICSIKQINNRNKIAEKEGSVQKIQNYPWGNTADKEKLNYGSNIGSVSSVGCYPDGASQYGCEEMSGNVWEWTRSVYDKYPYPSESDEDKFALKARESEESTGSRVLRGGSFSFGQDYVRCASRGSFRADNANFNVGFRVVLSPLL